MMISLAGCGAKPDLSKVTESTLGITKKDQVKEVAIEEFPSSDYVFEDLEAYVNSAVEQYNAQTPGAIKVDQLTALEDGRARLEMTYETVGDYSAFTEIPIEAATINTLDANAASRNFIAAADGAQTTLGSIEDTSLKAIVTETQLNIAFGGSVVYYSEGIDYEEGVAKTPANATAVILYK